CRSTQEPTRSRSGRSRAPCSPKAQIRRPGRLDDVSRRWRAGGRSRMIVEPVEPPPSRWDLPDPPPSSPEEPGGDMIAVGGDLEPGTVLDAYRRGLFPMRVDGMLAWWSPDPRGVIPLNGFHVSRSLRPARSRFEIRVDTSFEPVMRACADPRRPHRWLGETFV